MFHVLNSLFQEKNQSLIAQKQTVNFGGLVKSES